MSGFVDIFGFQEQPERVTKSAKKPTRSDSSLLSLVDNTSIYCGHLMNWLTNSLQTALKYRIEKYLSAIQ